MFATTSKPVSHADRAWLPVCCVLQQEAANQNTARAYAVILGTVSICPEIGLGDLVVPDLMHPWDGDSDPAQTMAKSQTEAGSESMG